MTPTALLPLPLALALLATPDAPGKHVRIRDLPDIVRPKGRAPTTAELSIRHSPGPDRRLPGGLRITTRCEDSCCVDGLMAGDKVLLAPQVDPDFRDHCGNGWYERVVRVAYQDESAVSIYVAESWFYEGAAHAHNRLRCRSFDIATRKQLRLADVRPGAAAIRALAQARRLIRDTHDLHGYTPNAAGIRFRGPRTGKAAQLGLQFCAEGRDDSVDVVEIDG